MHLERDQFVAATSEPVPLAPLGRRASVLLWGLRVFVVLVSLMVIYTFVDRLH
jgi:cytochrome c-type biogenesis protein CcmH/NrfF